VRNSRPTLAWMKSKGIRFEAMYGRQAHKVNGKFKFFAGLVCAFWGAGAGLVEGLHQAARKLGIPVRYETTALALLSRDRRVCGVRAECERNWKSAKRWCLPAADSVERGDARHLGPNWDLVKVRGTSIWAAA
jgi:tricarballylate dehydrogenase